MERNAQHAFDAEEVMAYLDGELEARRAAELFRIVAGTGRARNLRRLHLPQAR